MPTTPRGHTEAARKVSPHFESGGRTSPAPPTKAIAHPFFWPFSARGFWRPDLRALIFGRGCARDSPRAHRGPSQSLDPFRVRRTNFSSPPHQGYSQPIVLGFFRWGGFVTPTFGRGCARGLFLARGGPSQSLAPFWVRRTNFARALHQGYSPPIVLAFFRWGLLAPRLSCAAVPVAYFWHTEAARKIWGHSESGGRTSPTPPTKAIAHPFFGHFSAGGFWHHNLRAIIFGRGFARGQFLAHGGPSQSLVAFRVRRTKLASPTPQGYSPPVFMAFFRWTNLAPRPSGGYFWARLWPRPIFGTRRALTKSRGIPSPADEVGQPHPPRL